MIREKRGNEGILFEAWRIMRVRCFGTEKDSTGEALAALSQCGEDSNLIYSSALDSIATTAS
jgi:hypothetical protein